ncbi:MAG: PAS domain S-box protein [Saprospiraceae bacterium]|nr:PAS domain S-box protein [Saprospiraceae bacterium]MCF8250553.1 PAS domain S-box protein [Saprospiraceae bacterium]MCF8279693.1 PAS domain S-box protein [Bacteroidales bacterium]MCF8312479.1 PAS domain S-box protein [Saprospiraceae bacterium]MCF8440704.1 PAS domain S-box protein [Saprospiraceae bacterium]
MNQTHLSINQRDAVLLALFEYMPVGMILINRESDVLCANPLALSLLGIEPDEIMGRCVSDFIPALTEAVWEKGCNRAIAFPVGADQEVFALDGNGSKISVSVELAYVPSADDTLGIVFLKDNAQIQPLLRELKKAKKQSELKSHFASMASHGFRTPSTPIHNDFRFGKTGGWQGAF